MFLLSVTCCDKNKIQVCKLYLQENVFQETLEVSFLTSKHLRAVRLWTMIHKVVLSKTSKRVPKPCLQFLFSAVSSYGKVARLYFRREIGKVQSAKSNFIFNYFWKNWNCQPIWFPTQKFCFTNTKQDILTSLSEILSLTHWPIKHWQSQTESDTFSTMYFCEKSISKLSMMFVYIQNDQTVQTHGKVQVWFSRFCKCHKCLLRFSTFFFWPTKYGWRTFTWIRRLKQPISFMVFCILVSRIGLSMLELQSINVLKITQAWISC